MDGPITISSTMWLHVSCIITSQGGLTLSLSLKSACCVFWPLFNQSSHLVIVVSSIHQGIALVRRCMGVGWVLVRRWSGVGWSSVGWSGIGQELVGLGGVVVRTGRPLIRCCLGVGQALIVPWLGLLCLGWVLVGIGQVLVRRWSGEISGKRMRKSLVFTKETRQQCNNSLIFHAIHA